MEYGVVLDEAGWADLDCVIDVLHKKGYKSINEQELSKVIVSGDKIRHEINNGKIRATHGHSLKDKIKYDVEVKKPPKYLYHGTSAKKSVNIMEEGLSAMSRQYVHLSESYSGAIAHAKTKYTDIVVLRVDTSKVSSKFYNTSENVWLSHPLTPSCLEVMDK